jgi:hypothetical protein
MDDMTIYTPVQGSTCQNFEIPIFYLDPAYAGQNITVDLFDIGDVGGAAAFVGFVPPNANGGTCTTVPTGAWAQMPPGTSIEDLGTSIVGAGANESNADGDTTAGNPDTGSLASPLDNVIQTAAKIGNNEASLWNGQWLQFTIAVPPGYSLPSGCATTTDNTDCYWNLAYSVASNATAGDTFSIFAGFSGTPDRLLP